MKTKILFFAIVSIVLASCAPISYYQVYTVQPDNNIKEQNSLSLIFENEDCEISYNFNGVGANAGFKIYNKTNSMLYLNLSESFFVKNGIAYDYYQDKTYSEKEISRISLNNRSSVTVVSPAMPIGVSNTNQGYITTTKENGVSYEQKAVVLIPSNTAKFITEYSVTSDIDIYRDCDLLRFPNSKKEVTKKEFNSTNSPFIFSNRLSYKIGESGNKKNIENSFYVKEITNVPDNLFYSRKRDAFCDETSVNFISTSNYSTPDMFYVLYSKTLGDVFNH